MAIRHPGLTEVKEIAKQGMVVSFAVQAFRGESHHCYIGDTGAVVFSPNHGVSLRHDIAVALNFAALCRKDRQWNRSAGANARDAIRRARNDIALMALRSDRLP